MENDKTVVPADTKAEQTIIEPPAEKPEPKPEPKKPANAIGMQGTSADFENTGNPMDRELNPVIVNNQFVLANVYFKSQCFTKDCSNVEQVFIKMQAGRELGLRPLESMHDLCLIHGNIAFWGAGLVKRFRVFGWRIEYKDEVSTFDYKSTRGQKKKTEYATHSPDWRPEVGVPAGDDKVTVVVSKDDETYEYTVTLAEVEALGSNAVNIDRKAKLRYHGLARIARHHIPEVLGPINYVAEEMTVESYGRPSKLDAGKTKKQLLKEKQNVDLKE